MADQPYKRLSGRGNSLRVTNTPFARFSLWLGEDHVLQSCSYGYSEEYRRFYFRDIQAIVLRKTLVWTVVNVVCIIVVCLSALSWFAGDVGLKTFGAICGIPFLLFLVFNLLLGPTCECRLLTAVQTEPLPSLSRMRSARKAIGTILPLIERTQGKFQPPPPAPPGMAP
jgi:hypothetical protein